MSDTSTGAITAAQLIAYCDPLARFVASVAANMGLGGQKPDGTAETTTQCAYGRLARGAAQSVGHALLQARTQSVFDGLVSKERFDVHLNQFRAALSEPEGLINGALPPGWSFISSTQAHALDSHLLRLNAANTSVPTTPAAAGTVTATTVAGGAIPTCSAGNAPRIVHTLVSSAGDFYESLPSAQATQTPLAGTQNAYTYQIAGTVPALVGKVRTYRGYVAGGVGIYFYDQDTPVSPTAAYPAITIKKGDSLLLPSWTPPAWLCALMAPELAMLFAIAWGTLSFGQIQCNSNGMLTPNNVALGPSNIFLGLANPASSAIFGSSLLTGAHVATFTPGAILASNLASSNMQGFAGATGIQARATTTLNGTLHNTISYTYYDAAHGWGNVQTQVGITPVSDFAGGIAGETIQFSVPAGRIVLSVTETALSGTASSGAYVYEAAPVRAY